MPNRTDADSLSVSDIGVDSILDAAGLTEDDSEMGSGGESGMESDGISSWSADLGFGPDPTFTKEDPPVLDEAEFALAFDDSAPLVPDALDDAATLSGLDSGFFAGKQEEDIWEIPNDRSRLVSPAAKARRAMGQNGVAAALPAPPVGRSGATGTDPQVSQLPHFELDLPRNTIDPADQTIIAAQTEGGVPDARAGIVQMKRATRTPSPDDPALGSSTQRPVLIRPNNSLARSAPIDSPKNGGQVIARARVVSKVVRRRTAPEEPPEAEALPPDQIPTPTDFMGVGDADDTLPETEEELAARTTVDFNNNDGDVAPDSTRITSPTGAAALVAWMNEADEES